MREYLAIIQKSRLFSGITETEVESMLKCLSAVISEYEKNQFIFRFGDSISSLGLVLSGSVLIIKDDFWGNQNIIAKISEGNTFGETYACVQGEALSVSALAAEPSKLLFLNISRVINYCSAACEFHVRLIRNLLSVLAEKNLMLNNKLTHITQRSTREKLLSYLSHESAKQGSPSIEIPFNRQQLADYLSVERSSMSNELCKLRDEGFIEFDRNKFRLKRIKTSCTP